MPEGHSIHRLAAQHSRWFAGQTAQVSSPQGRFRGSAALTGHDFDHADAWGKHLFHHWSDGLVVHIHLGLFGRFKTYRGQPPAPRPTVRMRLVAPDRTLDLTGPTACELLAPEEMAAITARLGPDPLRQDGDPDKAWEALQRRKVGIGQALMDQRVLAGVGNIFRAEVLLAHGIHPDTPAKSIDRTTWHAMWATLQRWMRAGVKSGYIVTTDLDAQPGGKQRPPKRERLNVYGRADCRVCKGPVSQWETAGRTVWACLRCQAR